MKRYFIPSKFGLHNPVMERTRIESQRLSPPPELDQFTPAPANSFEVGSAPLFPYLDNESNNSSMSASAVENPELAEAADVMSSEMETEWYDPETVRNELTAKTLLNGVEHVLNEAETPLHIKEIIRAMIEEGYIHQGSKALTNLESVLHRETLRSRSKFKRVEGYLGWYQLVNPSHTDDQDETEENAAMSDEISRTENKLQRAKSERKVLLKRVVQHQSLNDAIKPATVNVTATATASTTLSTTTPAIKQEKTTVKQESVQMAAVAAYKQEKTKAVSKAKSRKSVVKIKQEPSSKTTSTKSASSEGSGTESKIKVKTEPQEPQTESPPPPQSVPSKQHFQTHAQQTPTAKPKRKKPGTAVKRKVQPIPVNEIGKPVFPIVLGGLTVHNLGEIIYDRPGFHSERYIWPVGYCSSRVYPSMIERDKKCNYTCKILDGGYGPSFEMCAEDDPDQAIVASSATACHCVVLKAINKIRGKEATNTGSGPEFFGFSHPTIQYLFQTLPGSKKCSKYQWVKFELPKDKLKAGTPVKQPGGISSSGGSKPSNLNIGASLQFQSEADDMYEGPGGMSTSLTLTSTISPMSSPGLSTSLSTSPISQLGTLTVDPILDPGMQSLMNSPPRSGLMNTLPMPLSPSMTTHVSSPTSSSQGNFMLPTSPLFGSASAFNGSDLPDSLRS